MSGQYWENMTEKYETIKKEQVMKNRIYNKQRRYQNWPRNQYMRSQRGKKILTFHKYVLNKVFTVETADLIQLCLAYEMTGTI